MTRRQREIYDFICGFVEEHGYSPSLEEIAAQFGLTSVATVHKHVQHLVEKGMLRKSWNRARSVEPVPQTEPEAVESVTLRLLGSVAAGAPIESFDDSETVSVPIDLVPPRSNSYVLRVRGDSMIEDQIADGDLVVVEERNEARNGETVVAMLNGSEATLKRFYRNGSQVKLVPANSEMEPIEVPAADVQIRGVLRGLIRRY